MNVMVICSHSPKDSPYLELVKTHLTQLKGDGQIDLFYESNISAGRDMNEVSKNWLSRADLCVLLLSADFFDPDDATMNHQLRVLLERQQRGELTLWPVLVRPFDYELTLLKSIDPWDLQFLSEMTDNEQELQCRRLNQWIVSLRAERSAANHGNPQGWIPECLFSPAETSTGFGQFLRRFIVDTPRKLRLAFELASQ